MASPIKSQMTALGAVSHIMIKLDLGRIENPAGKIIIDATIIDGIIIKPAAISSL